MKSICILRNRYNNIMWQNEFYIDYIDISMRRYNRIVRGMNIIAAIAASGSASAWFFFQKYAILWTLIVIAAEAIHIIRNYLPFDSRISKIKKLSHELSVISINFESHWEEVLNGSKNESEINDLIRDHTLNWENSMYEIMQEDVLPDIKRLIKRAEDHTKALFEQRKLFLGDTDNECKA